MTTFIKQETVWIALVPRLALLGILCLIFYQVDSRFFFMDAFILCLFINYTVKYSLIPNSTFTGGKLLRAGKFEEAIPFIQKDISYFTKRSWIDRFRFALMISSSSRSYKEISLCNMAYCLLQTGKIREAKELYESILAQYPENMVVKTQLKTIFNPSSNSSRDWPSQP
jgi:tetratricopeptide (TPR) repeat protein